MKRPALWICSLLMIGCAEQDSPPSAPQPAEVVYGSVKERDRSGKANGQDFTAVIDAQNVLTHRLFAALRAAHPDRNLAVSGYSVNQVLGMLYAGARGVTADQMQRVLGWAMPPDQLHAAMNALDLELHSRSDEVVFDTANRLWAQKGLAVLPGFLDVLTRSYGAPLAVTDFAGAPEAARAGVNGWVGDSTRGKIRELFPAGTIDARTVLVLVNALYLDAPWKYKFDPALTRPMSFRRLDQPSVTVDMMAYNDFLPSALNQEWQAVELPYRGDELSMVVIVPADLPRFEARLTPEVLAGILGQIKDAASISRCPSCSSPSTIL